MFVYIGKACAFLLLFCFTSSYFLMSITMTFSTMSKKIILALAFWLIIALHSSKRWKISIMLASLMKRAKFLAKFSSSCVI